MPLQPGTTLGPYEILSPLGAGGMGEVYRARDTKLNRDVALKVLPDVFADDPDRLARFQREAKVLASLNHPNIASIYGLEESAGVRALVLELVEGPTLADRIAQGPIPLDAALPIARQIAEALQAAHEAGVIHRDLKPANVKVKHDGTVKVLDFGLAKALHGDVGGDPLESPTQTAAVTMRGVIMGTIAYMSPEQVLGEKLDPRTDLFSFGVVLYEIATGTRPFKGNTSGAILDAVLHQSPTAPVRLNPKLPAEFERITNKALEKDCRLRYQTASDLNSDLARLKRDTDSGRGQTPVVPQADVSDRQQPQIIHPWEAVARDGRAFAERGSGIMYWFRVPLGGISYPEGFRHFLQPALENAHVSKIRFVLDASVPTNRETWENLVLPLFRGWVARAHREFRLEPQVDGGRLVEAAPPFDKVLTWAFADLSQEFSPCFKLFIDDLDTDEQGESQAQIFLATTTRTVRFSDGSRRSIRIPDTILRVRASEYESLVGSLQRIVNEWGFLFS